jgi:hypothetical protein
VAGTGQVRSWKSVESLALIHRSTISLPERHSSELGLQGRRQVNICDLRCVIWKFAPETSKTWTCHQASLLNKCENAHLIVFVVLQREFTLCATIMSCCVFTASISRHELIKARNRNAGLCDKRCSVCAFAFIINKQQKLLQPAWLLCHDDAELTVSAQLLPCDSAALLHCRVNYC